MSRVLGVLAMAFTLYQAARGALWADSAPQSPWLMIAALVLYLVVSGLSIFAVRRALPGEMRRHQRMPFWVAVAAVATAAVVPTMVGIAAGPGPTATSTTWFVGGLGTLMSIVAVRRRPILAGIGTLALIGGAMIWLGAGTAWSLGLVGSVLWVGVAILLVVLFDRAERDEEELAELQRATSTWHGAQEGRERERRVQVQRALVVSGPILTRVISSQGMLDDEERREAGLAEARLRDELRGPRLLDDAVRTEIEAARRRGTLVSVFDEGGLDGVHDDDLRAIRGELAEALHGATAERLIIRTSPHDRVAVTVVGRGRGLEDDGDEAVDLWREIEFPH